MNSPIPAEPQADATSPQPRPETLPQYVASWWVGVKSGELGSIPIVVGLLIVAIAFQSQNENFLTASNMVNLSVQAAAITAIAMGIVFVLLLGEIDLSIGYVSGVSGVTVALLTFPDGSNVFAAGPAIASGLLIGLFIGVLQGTIITQLRIPSFVVTLAGLLTWNGVVLILLGTKGTAIIQNQFIIGFANDFMDPVVAWIAAAAAVLAYAATIFWRRTRRRRARLAGTPDAVLALRVIALGVALFIAVAVANEDRGVPYVLLVLAVVYVGWTFVLDRTRFGLHIYAVGGNAEAARRAGIEVDRIRIACFGICSTMAALGGIVLASRLRSVDTNTGGGQILLYSIAAAVIGGTSLFGGRGNMKSAVLGALVIAAIDNGLGLLGLSAGTKFVVTGLALLAAVSVDALSRRGREHAGRA